MDALPEDILQVIFEYLEPKDFLSLCSTSTAFHTQFRYNSFYWRGKASSTFRLPISPLLHADGARWFWLYKKLKTQTCLYTWGAGVKGQLGSASTLLGPRVPRRVGRPHRPVTMWDRSASEWPTKVHLPDQIDIIVDLQCGGWSTNVLTSDGKLFSLGILDAADNRNVGEKVSNFTRLEYLAQSTCGIKQFSAGRRHVLALDDNREILSWDRINERGYKVFPRAGRDFGGKPKYVCAGWGHSSTYVPETGIIYWQPVVNTREDIMLDGKHVKEYVIPNTSRHRAASGENFVTIEVQKHVVLEGYIVFITTTLEKTGSETKISAMRVGEENPDESIPANPVFEVPGYSAPARELKDIQGSFRTFAVFTATGEVLAGNTDYLNHCAAALEITDSIDNAGISTPHAHVQVSDELLATRPNDVPALQHHGAIMLAFGDYHYFALHTDGKITGYGTDPKSLGALGLGNVNTGARFRGLRRMRAHINSVGEDSKMLPIAERRGRQVWFEPEKKEWLQWLENASKQNSVIGLTGPDHMLSSQNSQAAFSEWVEQEGRHWEDGPPGNLAEAPTAKVSQEDTVTHDYETLGAYFSINIAAAGWHSGALVLVNEEKAEITHLKWHRRLPNSPHDLSLENSATVPPEEMRQLPTWNNQHFPRVRLPDGTETAGYGEVCQWRDGMPSMDDLGLPAEDIAEG